MIYMVSIIIPVYNSSKTIRKSLNSVLNQTYKELEVIVVDDSSTDDTLSILHGYENDSRVKVFNIEHIGCVGAYIYGVKKATSPYVMMLDSDDEYKADYVFKMVTLIQKYKTDSVVSSYEIYDGKKIRVVCNGLKTGVHLTSVINKICNKALSSQYDVIPVRFTHIYKRDIIMSFLDELNYKVKQREDNIFNYLYLQNSNSIYIDNELRSYIYYVNPNSITNNYYSNYLLDFCYSVDYLYVLSNNYEECQSLLIDSISIGVSKSIDNNVKYKDIKEMFKYISKSELLHYKPLYRKYSFKEKMVVKLIFYNQYKLLYFLYKIIKKNYNG